ncbi:MAG: thiamine pyrophosphate-dependent enzyme, partial [Candidatus Promineifilaceae bacterium]
SDVPELLGQAFSIFHSERPRPVHLIVPIDVLAMEVSEVWTAQQMPARPVASAEAIAQSAELLQSAETPVILVGGGAISAGDAIVQLAEHLQAAVISSNNGKGILPATHPLNLGATISRQPTLDYLAQADVVLAIGTELASTDSYCDRLPIHGKLIRVDIDRRKINAPYPATVGIIADAPQAAAAIADKLRAFERKVRPNSAIDATREASMTPSNALEQQHVTVLNALRNAIPANGTLFGDMTQITYTASFAYPTSRPRAWHYMAGFGTLGSALPMAIGAKIAQPDQAVVAMCGDGGLMFTLPELMVAVELGLSLPILVWNNTSLGQIRDDMVALAIPKIGVDPTNPDYVYLCKAFGCGYVKPASLAEITAAVETAFSAETPTFIEVNQDAAFLL